MKIKTFNIETGEKDTLLVQPNKVTNARYEFLQREEDILTLMIEAIQKHMTREKEIQRDLFNQPIIQVHIDDKHQKQNYLYALSKMIKKTVSFEWKNSKTNEDIETTASLIAAYHDIKGGNYINVTLNVWAIPYLLYWGKGVGGTIFNKRIALTLNGKYSKRMYKLCKRWEDKGGFFMPLDEFRTMLNLPITYSVSMLKQRVLENSREEMMRDADVYFNYSITKENGSRSYNQINFKLFSNPKNIFSEDNAPTSLFLEDKGAFYSYVYRIASIAYPPIKSGAAFEITETLSRDVEKLKKAHDRFKRMEEENAVLNRHISESVPLIKYILDNDYGFNYMKKK